MFIFSSICSLNSIVFSQQILLLFHLGQAITDNVLPLAFAQSENSSLWIFIFYTFCTMIYRLNSLVGIELCITGIIDLFKINSHRHRHLVVLGTCAVYILNSSWMIFSQFPLYYAFNITYFSPSLTVLLLMPIMWVYGVDKMLALIECKTFLLLIW